MKTERINLWEAGEYSYPMAFGFEPNLRTYLHTEGDTVRPAMVVVPGGGYAVCAPSEAEPVAKKFYEMGFQCFVLSYTTNLLASVPLKDLPMRELGRAIRLIRSRAGEFQIKPDAVAICGFSAGGHLCGSVCVHAADIREENPAYAPFSARPDAAILSYPVITSGEFAHRDSFISLLGREASEEELTYASLETQVTKDTTPCFLWQTVDDELVPSENSILFAQALKKEGVPFAFHLFSRGPHGMSLADEDWAGGRFGDTYSMEQTAVLVGAIREGKLGESKELMQLADYFSNPQMPDGAPKEADPEVAAWPKLACTWFKKMGIL